jgi:hypothetical protein
MHNSAQHANLHIRRSIERTDDAAHDERILLSSLMRETVYFSSLFGRALLVAVGGDLAGLVALWGPQGRQATP